MMQKKNIYLFSFPVEIVSLARRIGNPVNRYIELMTMLILLSSKRMELNGKMQTDKQKTM
jgi:hypothetical protein